MSVDKDFLKYGYFESRGGQCVIRADLMADHARPNGERFAGQDRKNQVYSIQVRAFYSDVKALERKINEGGEGGFERFLYLIKMLKSKASYIQGKRSGRNVSVTFRDYIHTCVDAIQTPDDFEAFLKFFDSTVGFYYGAGGERIT
jgi:CRISPR type III-A-associated protein Csm2